MVETTTRTSRAAAPLATSVRGRVPTLRRFFGAPQRWFLADGGLLTFAPGAPSDAAETFAVDADGTALPLRLDAGAASAAVHWSDYRGRSRLLAWSLAHEMQLMRLSEALGLSLLPVETAVADDGDRIWLRFEVDDAPAEGGAPMPARTGGAIGFPSAWLDRVLTRAEPVYADDPLPDLDDWLGIPAPVRIAFAGPTLTAAEWLALHPGDVILAGNRRAPVAFEARSSGRAWPLSLSPDGWRVQGDARPAVEPKFTELAMTNETDTPPEDGADAAVADHPARQLPVQVAFDIGQIELTVGDLASLQPGYVFALPAHLEGSNVTIRANGHKAGRGEIVAVGDTIGVRLLAWG